MVQKNLLFELSDSLCKKVYKLTFDFPYKYQSSVGDQLRRAILSVVLNIVEAGARLSQKGRRQLLSIAYGSLKEAKYLVSFSHELKLIKTEDFEDIMSRMERLAAILYGLLRKNKNT